MSDPLPPFTLPPMTFKRPGRDTSALRAAVFANMTSLEEQAARDRGEKLPRQTKHKTKNSASVHVKVTAEQRDNAHLAAIYENTSLTDILRERLLAWSEKGALLRDKLKDK